MVISLWFRERRDSVTVYFSRNLVVYRGWDVWRKVVTCMAQNLIDGLSQSTKLAVHPCCSSAFIVDALTRDLARHDEKSARRQHCYHPAMSHQDGNRFDYIPKGGPVFDHVCFASLS